MRQTNWRLVIVGVVLALAAVGFFLVMMGMASKSTDPKAMMTTVGQVSGVVGALGALMAILGFVGRKS